jgi:DNA-binding beta-propeller fold protein YncE
MMLLQRSFRCAAPLAALACVTACAQNATPISAPLPAAGSSSTHFASRPLASKTKIYVYAVTGGDVDVFRAGPTPKIVDTITQGLSFPLGITIDKSGTLYVANNGNATVTEYPAGQNTPSVTLTQGLLYPNAVAVDGSGNLWVANGTNVLEFPAGSQSPSLTLTNGIDGAAGIAVNAQGTVYVANLPGSGSPYVAVFPSGATKPTTTFGESVLEYPCGVTLDQSANVYVADFDQGEAYVFSHKNYKLLRTVNHQPYFSEPCGVSIDIKSRVYLGGGGNSSSLNLLQVPRLGKGSATVFYETGELYGVAADPTIEP